MRTRLLATVAPTNSKTVRIGYKGPSSVLYHCTLSVKLSEDRSPACTSTLLVRVHHEDYIFGTYTTIRLSSRFSLSIPSTRRTRVYPLTVFVIVGLIS